MPPPKIDRGEIIVTSFPFTDLSGSSIRPAVVISPGLIGDDIILAAISSVVRGAAVPIDLKVESNHAEFPQTGLRVTSVIRLHKLVNIEHSLIKRRLGKLGPQLQKVAGDLLPQAIGL